MARALIWSPTARADLHEIEAYLASRSPLSARHVIEKIREAATTLREFPYSARVIPEFQDPARRETFVHEWRLMYCVEPDHIRVLRGRRLLKNVPGSFEEMAQEAYSAA